MLRKYLPYCGGGIVPYSPSQIASRASIGLLLVVFAIAVLSFGSRAARGAVGPLRSVELPINRQRRVFA